MGIRKGIIVVCLAVGAVAPVSAQIDPLAELDSLSRASGDAASGLALAHRQMAANDLIGATATVERVITLHPESDEALLLHAALLCSLDDLEGARTELAELSGRSGGRSPVTMTCGPGTRGRN